MHIIADKSENTGTSVFKIPNSPSMQRASLISLVSTLLASTKERQN